MSAAMSIRDQLLAADLKDQRGARKALLEMFRTSSVRLSELDSVATVSRLQRKSVRHLTVSDLIEMGIVTIR